MWRLLAPLVFLLPTVLAAQTDDRSYLTAFLEDNLSDIGRTVTITGFAGALSSQATITSMTIADKDGIWLTLNGVALDWNRAALFTGRVSVNALTAQEIIFARAPVSDASAPPSPEASGFSLPDLPVSIDIGRIAADRIVLGVPIMGTQIEGTFAASLSLAGGEGQANLALDRTDSGPDGNVSLTASYSNTSRQLVMDLDATEAAGGIAATVLAIPGVPSASLTIKGSGSVDDFSANVALATDGADRLSGTLALGGAESGATQFSADLKGDLAPIFVPKYADFFGSDVALSAVGARTSDGRTELSKLSVRTRALTLNGNLAVAPDGTPDRFSLNAVLKSPDGKPVLLPLTSDHDTRISTANLDLSFDAAKSDNWAIKGSVEKFDRQTIKISRLSLDGSGKINQTADGRRVEFTTTYGATGVTLTDQAIAQAVGQEIAGSASGLWTEQSGQFRLSDFKLMGDAVNLSADGTLQGIESGFAVDGKIVADIADMQRFSAVAGRPLSGQTVAEIAGTASLLGGTFDLAAVVDGSDVGVGQRELDALLKGKSKIEASVLRSETGTDLRKLVVSAATLQLTAAGKIATAGNDLVADLNFTDLASMGRQYRGALSAKATLIGTPQSGTITLNGQGTGLGVGQSEADKLLRGISTLSASLVLQDGAVIIKDARLANPQVTLAASAPAGVNSQIDLSAKLANLGLLVPEFSGSVTLSGTAKNEPAGIAINLRAEGPGQINATAAGAIATSGTADLAIRGTGQAALANAFIGPRAISGKLGFDLRLNGPIRLAALNGRILLSDGRITSPEWPFALQNASANAEITGGQAQVSGTAAVSTGGATSVNGSLGLFLPNAANLSLAMRDVVLRDPQLYETQASGKLTVQGPLSGGAVIAGRIDLRNTELQIPASGLSGVEVIPELRHLRESNAVRNTRVRAGLLAETGGDGRRSVNRAFGLDIAVAAPNRVFLRGRGLDAELGGSLRLRGTTADVVPDGSFNLIRGRLDILGKRLTLTEAQLRLEGDFVPFVRIAASTESDGVTSSVLIEGLTSDPKVSFTSSPALPQEEVLSRLLFGRGLETLSAFQAAQLAGAVASLAGKGGEGIAAKLRKGFGLDDLDVRTDDAGTASLRAGKYIARNVYSEIELDQNGKSQVQLNLDVTNSVTLRGKIGSNGQTGIGVFLENDY